MIRQYLTFLLLISCILTSCSNKYQKLASRYQFTHEAGVPDYGNPDHWAALPGKWDPSDSIPQPLRSSYDPDTTADVFFIYPTTYTDKHKALGWNAPIDNAELNAKTDYSTILFQASVFNEAGKVYAPRYRQANYYAYFPVTAEDSLQAYAAFEMAYQDVKTAFQYFLTQYNHGRPIIIAAHSQGTQHAKRLLKEFFDGKDLSKQLVAAYLVGMPLEPDWFSTIQPCITPTQTGCAVSWRTLRDGYKPAYVAKEKFVSVVTNPLTWDSNKQMADRTDNKGGLLLNFNKLIPKITNAHATEGVLWTDKPHFFGNLFLTTKNYHVADLNLFYLNVRENVKQRVQAFKQLQTK